MTDELKASGIKRFAGKCAENGWLAPKLYSAWFISRMPNDPDGQKQVEEANSLLGLELARELSSVAKLVRETNESTKLEEASDTLFYTAKWIGTQLGYGNLFLQDRAYDIASIAVLKLMADLAYPMESAEAAMKRFEWKWSDPSKRRQVLYEESGRTHFKLDSATSTNEELDLEFRKGVSQVLRPGAIEGNPDLAIFVIENLHPDESFLAPETTWQRRGHFMIAETSFKNVNLCGLDALHEFRKRYGRFPTKPVKYVKGDTESDIQAAFWELCWEKPYGVEAAYIVYEQYIKGTLSDRGWQGQQARNRVGTQLPK